MPDAAVNVLIARPLEAELATALEAADNLRRWLDGRRSTFSAGPGATSSRLATGRQAP
jgi:hypothetical protein